MNKNTLIHLMTTLGLTLFVANTSLHAVKIPFFFSYGAEKIIKVADFPDTPKFKFRNGKFVDLGYKFKQVNLFGLPLWNYDGTWCGYMGDDTQYVQINETDLAELAKIAKVTIPATASLSFWDMLGGKLVFLGILGLLLAYQIFRMRSKNAPDETTPQ